MIHIRTVLVDKSYFNIKKKIKVKFFSQFQSNTTESSIVWTGDQNIYG